MNGIENGIAIIGMAGRFPGSENLRAYWDHICNGTETISHFNNEELEKAIKDPKYVKSRGILKDVEYFDADFFGLGAKEAEITDPQHRLFLECAWEAMENAGYLGEEYPGSIGVYGGCGPNSYYLNHIHPHQDLKDSIGEYLLHIGNEKDYLATRVSYKLNLKGPSLTVQTACSTALTAVCTACNHLLTYQCDMALAGGVAISTPQKSGYAHKEGSIFSPDGSCRPFDSDAQGTVPGNGAGIVVLKRLENA